MADEDREVASQTLVEHLSKVGNKSYRRYELRSIDGRLMLVRNEICRALDMDMAIADAFGVDLEPDDQDGIFLN